MRLSLATSLLFAVSLGCDGGEVTSGSSDTRVESDTAATEVTTSDEIRRFADALAEELAGARREPAGVAR